MSYSLVKLPSAERDLIGCYAYLGEHASIATADRFLKAVETTLGLIAKSPGIGTPYPTSNPKLAKLRALRVSKFKRYLLFYLVHDDQIELVRVLYGARNIRAILDVEGAGEE
jgi:toxin ParE1/3/4